MSDARSAILSYRGYLLAILLVILSFNSVDRLALGLVLQAIKTDLRLSDTQLGVLTGIAFALFYSVMGVPIARWADRGNRVTIISLTVAVWSAMVSLSALAMSFTQLMLIRIGVAVGEAGCMPPAHSLIADHFTRSERPKAVALYMLGTPLSALIGYFAAGWLNQWYGWRPMFVILGCPGLVLSAIVWFTLKEPRERLPVEVNLRPAQPSFQEVCTALFHLATFRQLFLCFVVMCFFGYGISLWLPAFFIRTFHLGTGELGAWFTVIYGLGGIAGTYIGGSWASRHAAHNERLQLAAMAAAYVCSALLSGLMYLASSQYIAFVALTGTALIGAATNGPLFAMIQTLVPARMRATAIALIYLFANLIGMGLGPLAAGALSDALKPMLGEQSLRGALLCLCPCYFWGALYLWRARNTVGDDLGNRSEEGRY